MMIMDEVITAFRLSRGGAQGRFGVMPDLTTMAKIVAGGLPGGAVAGKSEIMDLLAPGNHSNYMSHPGTFIANPLSASAGIACLEMIANEPVNERADAMAERLKAGMRDALGRTEVTGARSRHRLNNSRRTRRGMPVPGRKLHAAPLRTG